MEYRKFLFNFYFIFLIGVTNCWDGNDRYIGKLSVPVTDNVFFKIYQSKDLEQFTAISCEVVDENDSLLTRRAFLTGTDLYERNTKNFISGEYDSLIYLTYFRPNVVVAIYDLKNQRGYPFDIINNDLTHIYADSLLMRLQSFDSNLLGYWHR